MEVLLIPFGVILVLFLCYMLIFHRVSKEDLKTEDTITELSEGKTADEPVVEISPSTNNSPLVNTIPGKKRKTKETVYTTLPVENINTVYPTKKTKKKKK